MPTNLNHNLFGALQGWSMNCYGSLSVLTTGITWIERFKPISAAIPSVHTRLIGRSCVLLMDNCVDESEPNGPRSDPATLEKLLNASDCNWTSIGLWKRRLAKTAHKEGNEPSRSRCRSLGFLDIRAFYRLGKAWEMDWNPEIKSKKLIKRLL